MVSLAQNEQGTICPAQGFTLSGRFSRSIFLVYSQNTFLLGHNFYDRLEVAGSAR